LWTEQAGPQNLDPIVWPRAAVSAEVSIEHSWSWSALTEVIPRSSGLEQRSQTGLRPMSRRLFLVSMTSVTAWRNEVSMPSICSLSGVLCAMASAIWTL